jgi:hypothetical protein
MMLPHIKYFVETRMTIYSNLRLFTQFVSSLKDNMNYIFISLFHPPIPLILLDLLNHQNRYQHLRLITKKIIITVCIKIYKDINLYPVNIQYYLIV